LFSFALATIYVATNPTVSDEKGEVINGQIDEDSKTNPIKVDENQINQGVPGDGSDTIKIEAKEK